jgi:hypothetical protein
MFKSIFFQIFSAILILLAGYFVIFYNRSSERQEEVEISLRDYLLRSFISELPEINKKLPYKIDNYTILNSIKYEDSKILSTYKLTNYNSNSEESDFFTKTIKPILQKKTCTDEVKTNLLDVGIEFLDVYKDPEGAVILEVLSNSNLCKKLTH